MAVKIWKAATSNAFSTDLNGNITSGDETIALTSASGLQYPGIIVVDRVNSLDEATPLLREYISYTGITSNSLTGCSRGVASSTAQAHLSGATVEEVFSVTHWADLISWLTVEHALATGKQNEEAWVDASDGGTVTFDLSSGNKQRVTLGGNRTLALSNVSAGHVFLIKLTQDGTGSRTVTWFNTISWADGTAPTLTTTLNKSDIFSFVQTGIDTYDGFTVGANL